MSVHIAGSISDVYVDSYRQNTSATVRITKGVYKKVTIPKEVFLPVRPGDNIDAYCDLVGNELVINMGPKDEPVTDDYYDGDDDDEFIFPPCVVIPETKATALSVFKIKRMPQNKTARLLSEEDANTLYDYFYNDSGPESRRTDSAVFRRIFREVVDFNVNVARKNADAVEKTREQFSKIIRTPIEQVFRAWYSEVIIRSFNLVALTKKDLMRSSAGRTLFEMYIQVYTNPYKILKLKIEQCHEIAARLRLPVTEEHIRTAEIARALVESMEEDKAVAMPLKKALEMFPEELKIYKPILGEYGIHYDGETRCLYTSESYKAELYVAKRIAELSRGTGAIPGANLSLIGDGLDPEQYSAVLKACSSGFSIITGRGGSGKTTIQKVIVQQIEALRIPYVLCAFTGKAVSNMYRSSRRPAFTIDSLLTRDLATVATIAGMTEKATAESVRIVIIDEISMVSTDLMYKLLKRFPKVESLIISGDHEQLEPIAPGAFYDEILESGAFDVVRLKKNHRIATCPDVAAIISNIIRLNESSSFFFSTGPAFRTVYGEMDAVHRELIAYSCSGKKVEDLALITPYDQAARFIHEKINHIIRTLFFPETLAVDPATNAPTQFYPGARVMQLDNNYEYDVKNGEEGIVQGYERDEMGRELLVVKFESMEDSANEFSDERLIRYIVGTAPAERAENSVDWSEETEREKGKIYTSSLTISFITTIVKYQGSERDHIICYFPKHGANHRVLNKRLINVAITRARKSVVVVGALDDVTRGASVTTVRRCANLGARIKKMMAE